MESPPLGLWRYAHQVVVELHQYDLRGPRVVYWYITKPVEDILKAGRGICHISRTVLDSQGGETCVMIDIVVI